MDRFEQLREEIKQWVRKNLVGKKVYRNKKQLSNRVTSLRPHLGCVG
jgi:hypothetical protein